MLLQKFLYKNVLFSVALIAAFSLNSCYYYRVATKAQPGTEFTKVVTVHSFFWGLVKNPREINTPVCDSLGANGLAIVTMKTNFGYALITVATLGIWSPVKVEYKCSMPCKQP